MESRRPPKGQNMLAVLVAGGVLSIILHEARVLEQIGFTERPTTEQLEVAPTTTLTSEQRTELYGAQKLFICQIPDENGVLQTVEINIGGPETPFELALTLAPEPTRAIELLNAGVTAYNELQPSIPVAVDLSTDLGVRKLNNKPFSVTQWWGVKYMTVLAYQESTG